MMTRGIISKTTALHYKLPSLIFAWTQPWLIHISPLSYPFVTLVLTSHVWWHKITAESINLLLKSKWGLRVLLTRCPPPYTYKAAKGNVYVVTLGSVGEYHHTWWQRIVVRSDPHIDVNHSSIFMLGDLTSDSSLCHFVYIYICGNTWCSELPTDRGAPPCDDQTLNPLTLTRVMTRRPLVSLLFE